MSTMSTPTRPPIPSKPTKIHTPINNHIAILKRIPAQLIQRRAERFLPPVVPVAAGFAVQFVEALVHELRRDGLVEEFGERGGAGEVGEGGGGVEGCAGWVGGEILGLAMLVGGGAVAAWAGGGVGHAWTRD